jgi:DNA-binding NarL/FixJ family response regulator
MIRLLIADDHKLFWIGLQKMLWESGEIKVVGEARTGEEAVTLCRELSPNIVLMDICMPGIGGLEATRRITQRQSGVQVIILTGFEDSPYPLQALKAGATGYLTKKVNADELLRAIKRVFLGKRYLSGEIAQQLAVHNFEEEGADPFGQLSSREMQIMLMVVNCQKVKEISSNLHLSPKTVNSYRYRIFEKLNVGSDVELALMAVRYGVVNGGAQFGRPRQL